MPNTGGLGEGLMDHPVPAAPSPRLLAGESGVIKMPEQAIEMEEMLSPAESGRGGRARRTTSTFSLGSPKPESDLTPGEAFMLKFSRMSTHLANERTLLAWLRTSAAFFSIGLAFAKIDEFEDDLVSISFVSVGILTFIVGCIRYYQVKMVLETKDSDFKVAQGFKRLGAGRMLSAAVVAFGIAATCLLYQSFRELSTTGVHYTGAGEGTDNGKAAPSPPAGASGTSGGGTPDAQLLVLQQILAALNSQSGGGDSGGGDKPPGGR